MVVSAKPRGNVEQSEKRGRVLVIDDNEKMLDAVARILRPAWDIVAVTDARDALRRLTAREAFDVILCDVVMPHTSGIDFYRSIQERLPELTSKIAFMTGGSAAGDAFLATIPNRSIAK